MNRFNALVARFPKTVIGLTLLITVGAVMLLPGIKMDSNPYPLNKSHPSMVAFHKLKTDFTGTLETALIHLRHPETVFNAGTVKRVSAITAALEEISLVSEQDTEMLSAFLPRLPGEAREILGSLIEGGITRDDDFALLELTDWIEANADIAPGLD